MNFERRDFLRLGTAGFAGTMLSLEPVFGQEKDADDKDGKSSAIAELRGGSGSLHLQLKLRAGTLEMQYEEFSQGKDHAMVAHGTFAPHGGSKTKVYRSYFSANNDQQVFARFGDGDDWTSIVLASTGDANVESLTVWNDRKAPESFRIDKQKFLAAAKEKGVPKPQDYIIDSEKGNPDLRGSRTPPDITVEDLEDALQRSRDFLAFRRGASPTRLHATALSFPCGYIVIVFPGGTLVWGTWDAWDDRLG